MRSILRFTFLNIFIFCFVGLIELLLIQMIFSSPQKIKTMLSDAQIYSDLTSFVNKKLQESDGGAPVSITEPMVRKTAETLIDQTWDWASGKTSQEPSLSLRDLLESAGLKQQDLKQFTAMQEEFTQALADPVFKNQLPPESRQAMEALQKFGGNGRSFSLGSHLLFIKSMVSMFTYGIPVMGILSLISLVMIVILSNTNQSRAMWLFVTFLLTSGTFLFTAGLFALPKLFIPVILSQMQTDTSYGEGLLTAIIVPISSILFRQHLAVAVGIFCVAIVCLLARVMVFNNPVQMVELKKKNKSTG